MISMDSEAFADVKRNIDSSINNLLGRMQYYDEDEGTLSMKMTISLYPVFDKYGVKTGTSPKIKYKVSVKVNHSEERKGEVFDEYLLVEDGDGYKLTPMAVQTKLE